MSTYPPPGAPGYPPPPQPGLGCFTRLLILLGFVFLLLIVLCCGGFGLIFYHLKGSMSDDPTVVIATTAEITQIDVPAPLKPAHSIDMSIPVAGKVLFASYMAEEQQGVLVLFGTEGELASKGRFEVRRSVVMQSVGGTEAEDREVLENRKEYQKKIRIRDEMATFTIAKGTGSISKTPRIQVDGIFRGKNGPAMLILDADERKISEDAVVKMLESIR